MLTLCRWGLIVLALVMGIWNGLGTGFRIGVLLGLLPPPATPVPHLAFWMLPVVIGWIALLLVGAVQLIRCRSSAGWIFVASCVLFALHMAYFMTAETYGESVRTGGAAIIPLAVYFGIFAILIGGGFAVTSKTRPEDRARPT